MLRAAVRGALVVAAVVLAGCDTPRDHYGYYDRPPSRDEARPVKPGHDTERQIERAMDRYSSMLATMDADGIAEMYTPDGVFERASGPPLRGRDAIRSFLSAPAGNVRVMSNRMTTISLSYEGEQVVQNGEFEQSTRVNGKAVNARGRFQATWVRGPRGTWYISRMVTRPARN